MPPDALRPDEPPGRGAVRPARPGDVAVLARVLSDAFHDDPVHAWLFPDPALRARRHPRLFRVFLRHALRHGLVLTRDALDGAALWELPRDAEPSAGSQLGLGLRLLPVFGRRAGTIARGMGALPGLHPRAPHWYLALLGTDPPRQGRGVASSLVRAVLARCDADGVPAYLEASRAENVPFYERLGFAVVAPYELPDGPTVWRMLRPPR